MVDEVNDGMCNPGSTGTERCTSGFYQSRTYQSKFRQLRSNVVCGSGLKCVNEAATMIMAGEADIVVAGGMENMSMAPYAMTKARFGYRMNNATIIDTMVNDALTDAFNHYHMMITAENVCDKYGITREELDEFSANSQQKCEKAIAEGKFEDEIVPVPVKVKKEIVDFVNR